MKQATAAATRAIDIVRVRGGGRARQADRAAVEEPLEIRLHGRPFAVIMRTPGADRELAAGFLLSERVLRHADDLGTIEYCREGDPERVALRSDDVARPFQGRERQADVARPFQGRERQADVARPFQGRERQADVARPFQGRDNVINVTLTDPSIVEALVAERRNVTANSSCGLCGRATIESLAADVDPIRTDIRVSAAILSAFPNRLRTAQTVFDETGGLHAAGLFSPGGALVQAAEDVGRHNAVDKIVGRQLMADALPLSDAVLFVSGRTSYEIVQKALFGGISIVASVSAPSSLAIELADAMGITLVGFVRGGTFNIYTHPDRIRD